MLADVITLRPVDLTADLEALYQVALASETAVVDDPDTSRSDISGMFTSPEADLVGGSRVAVDDTGAPLGFVAVFYDTAGREVTADAYVHPTAGDDVWDRLLEHASAYAAARMAALDPDDAAQWTFCAGSYAQDTRYASALRRQDLSVVRRFHSMGVTFDPADPPRPPAPLPGVTVTVVGEDEALLRAAHEVANTSFTEHWNHVPRPYDLFMEYVRSQDAFDPTQWWLASVDGTPAGVSLGNEHLAENGWGYVGTLGVVKEFRHRGIARLLLETAFAEAYARGRVGVKLGVDSENSTGAPALYTAVGMRPLQEIDFWARPIV